jgi:glycosyltransferase involved in cell wall biosynthesis
VSSRVSVVIPCLNEEECIERCIQQIRLAFSEPDTEILVVDNGSTDRSAELALKAGARVVEERRKGYGSAILRGLHESRGDYLVIGDADNTYDFSDARPLVEALKEGADFAIGNRLAGQIEPGAMPWMHRYFLRHSCERH